MGGQRLAVALCGALFACSGAWAVVYVNADNVAGRQDGRSWATAFASLQEAIDAAAAAGGDEVWVAAGTYRPSGEADRAAAFYLRRGVELYGGFRGTEKSRAERNWKAQRTVLSGDIGRPGELSDNCYHVVIGADGAVLDGFVITWGNAHDRAGFGGRGARRPMLGAGPLAPRGAGGQHITPEIILSQLGARRCGGGMYNFRASPVVANCRFVGNFAGKGGAMYNASGSCPKVVNCTFSENGTRSGSENVRGGAVANDLGAHPVFERCLFLRNATMGKGGAIYNDFGSSPIFLNCVFFENFARVRGGALANDGGSSPILINCTLAQNRAGDLGGALYNGTHRAGTPGPAPALINCIVWANSTPYGPLSLSSWHEDEPNVAYCDVQGGYPGEGNIAADPLFVAPERGDFRLRSGSPCIDAGKGGLTSAEVSALLRRWLGSMPPFEQAQLARLRELGLAALHIPQRDAAGRPRCDAVQAKNGPAAGNPPVDIGAYEWQPGEQ